MRREKIGLSQDGDRPYCADDPEPAICATDTRTEWASVWHHHVHYGYCDKYHGSMRKYLYFFTARLSIQEPSETGPFRPWALQGYIDAYTGHIVWQVTRYSKCQCQTRSGQRGLRGCKVYKGAHQYLWWLSLVIISILLLSSLLYINCLIPFWMFWNWV